MDTDKSPAECCCVGSFPRRGRELPTCDCILWSVAVSRHRKASSDTAYRLADLECVVGVLGRVPPGGCIVLLEGLG